MSTDLRTYRKEERRTKLNSGRTARKSPTDLTSERSCAHFHKLHKPNQINDLNREYYDDPSRSDSPTQALQSTDGENSLVKNERSIVPLGNNFLPFRTNEGEVLGQFLLHENTACTVFIAIRAVTCNNGGPNQFVADCRAIVLRIFAWDRACRTSAY
jgi:hypothetical protein